MNQHDIFSNRVAIPVRIPSSYKSLPAPRVPSARRFEEVAILRRSLIEKAGIHPGTYTTPFDGPFEPIEDVFEGMTDYLINALSDCDVVNLCKRLYYKHEEFLGHVNKSKYYSVPSIMYGDATHAATNELELWQQVTPLTESLRWLIEVAVKHSKSPGITPGNAKVDHLFALAIAIYMWDFGWEHVAQGILPNELCIDQDYDMTFGPTDRGIKIQDTYRNALKPHLEENKQEWVNSVQRPNPDLTIGQLMELPSLQILDLPLEQERGYSMTDWFRFSAGLIDSFDITEYCQFKKVTRLSRFTSRKWGIRPERLENLLVDFGLSRQVVENLKMCNLRPVEHARRDSRLLRRPVVLLGSQDKRLCIYGIETVEAYGRKLLERLISGRASIPMQNRGAIKRAVGRIQSNLGDEFRNCIADRCSDEGFEMVKEKKRIEREQIPQGRKFGPIDVFVVDRKFRRFVLVETKDVADEGTVPKLIKIELKDFQRAIGKLERQIAWFKDRVESLKAELGLSPDEDYAVEGVIVISSPRLWMYAQPEPLPVVDEYEFFRILNKGGRFETEPVP